MNALVPKHAAGGALALPAVSRALSAAAEALLEPVARYVDPNALEGEKPLIVRREPPRITAADRQEAEWALEQMGDTLAQATPDALRAWLKPINAGVRNPQDAAAFALRCTAIVLACDGIPVGALTPEAQRDALRTFEFFPSAPEVHALLQRHAAPILRAAEGYQRVVDAPEPAEEPKAAGTPSRTPQEIAHVQEQLAALKRDLVASREAVRPMAVQPRRLTDAQLIEAYRQQAARGGVAGNLARARLAYLERQAQA